MTALSGKPVGAQYLPSYLSLSSWYSPSQCYLQLQPPSHPLQVRLSGAPLPRQEGAQEASSTHLPPGDLRALLLPSVCALVTTSFFSVCMSVFLSCHVHSLSFFGSIYNISDRVSLVAQTVENLPAVPETWLRSLGREDPPEKKMATHSSILAWRIPWTQEPGGLQSVGSQRPGHDLNNLACTHACTRVL